MTKRVLITGCAGYLGSKLVNLLTNEVGWEVYGIDVKEPANKDRYELFVKDSVTNELVMQEFFDRSRPDVAIHLAFVVTSTHNKKLEESIAVDGAQNFLNGCERTNAPKAIFLSSVAAYGAHDDNDVPLLESSKIRGVEGYGYSRLKAKVDLMAQSFAAENEWCEFTILRPCLFVGANTNNNFFDILKFPIVPMVRDKKGLRDPLFQFIHEDDMALCLFSAIKKSVRGIFNVAGSGTEKFSSLIAKFGKKSIGIPSCILYPVTSLLWRLHLVTSPPAQLDFIRYPWIMDVTRMRDELYVPQKSTIEAFEEFARVQR